MSQSHQSLSIFPPTSCQWEPMKGIPSRDELMPKRGSRTPGAKLAIMSALHVVEFLSLIDEMPGALAPLFHPQHTDPRFDLRGFSFLTRLLALSVVTESATIRIMDRIIAEGNSGIGIPKNSE